MASAVHPGPQRRRSRLDGRLHRRPDWGADLGRRRPRQSFANFLMTDKNAATSLRTHRAGSLRREHAGATVRLGGWVHRTRDLGGLLFLDLRDREGLVQICVNPDTSDETKAIARSLGQETVILVEGVVRERDPGMRNPEMTTGDVEVHATSIRVVGPAAVPAIP